MIYLAIDAGGTHTRCAVVTEQGLRLGLGESGPANWSTLGPEVVRDSVAAAVTAARQAAGLAEGEAEIGGACVALAGYFPAWHQPAAVECLTPICGERLRVEPDLKAAWAGAFALAPGVVVVAGTGSVAYGEDAAGEAARAGGWGPLAGDEGSAFWIGSAALRAVARALDGRGPKTALVDALGKGGAASADAKGRSPEEALRAVYREGWGRAQVAALAPAVARAAAAGDRVAAEILEEAAAALGELALTVVCRLEGFGRVAGEPAPASGNVTACQGRRPEEALPISLTGGVAAAGEPLLKPFRRWLALTAPHARVVPPRGSPLDGAALLAMERFGKEPPLPPSASGERRRRAPLGESSGEPPRSTGDGTG